MNYRELTIGEKLIEGDEMEHGGLWHPINKLVGEKITPEISSMKFRRRLKNEPINFDSLKPLQLGNRVCYASRTLRDSFSTN